MNAEAATQTLLGVLTGLFAELTRAGVPFAVLQADGNLEAALRSDVDLALGEHPGARFEPVLRHVAAALGLSLINVLHYEIPAGYYYILATAGPERRFLHLDCLFDPTGLARYRIPTPRLVATPDLTAGYPRARPGVMAGYLLVKRALKGQQDPARLHALRHLLAHHGAEAAAEVQAATGCPIEDLVTRIREATTDEAITLALAALGRRLAANPGSPLRRLERAALGMTRQAGRFLKPTGYFLVVVGPDGCGKSTVTAELLAQLDRAFRHTARFHWRPGLLPKLGRTPAGDGVQQAPPTGASRYTGIVSLARFAYYSLDFVLGYWLRLYPARARTTLLLGERYYADVLVNPARYGFAVPRWLRTLTARLVPRPDLTVLLSNEPAVIHARKPELPVAAIADQLGRFQAELPRWGAHLQIATTAPPGQVAATIAERILADCAARTARRLGGGPAP